MRSFAWLFLFFTPTSVLACKAANPASPPAAPSIQGVVADPTGAIVPGAEVDLVDTSGAITCTGHSGQDGSFQLSAPRTGSFTLVVSEPGFETVHNAVVIPAAPGSPATGSASHIFAAPVRVILPVAALATNVHVNADTSEDLTAPDDNKDSSVMTADDLKALPVFDNDYATAMSAFLDDSATATGGTGLIVDGVEANRATISPSAVQEVRINQDPYSAQYYWPGRGQMEIISKSAADHYHGQFNFYFRDSALNAQNALAPSKPFEQRRIYEGHFTGPLPGLAKSSFLGTFNRAEEDLDAVVDATVLPTPANPAGFLEANVPAPTRDTEFSLRLAHRFGDKHSAYAQYSYQDWTGENQAVGGQSLASAGFNNEYHEDDATVHVDSALSAVLLNQFSAVGEHDFSRNVDASEAPRISVTGDFTAGSAQNDSLQTEYNFRLFDMVTWTHGHHMVKAGIGIPHLNRRAFDDNTDALGTYTFGPTLASDGVTVLQSALENYQNSLPSGYAQNSGVTHFIYHQQEMGAFVQDQWKINDRVSITPGLRYDWQNFLARDRLGFSPRVSFAWVLDPDAKVVLRGGGGVYYDRFGSAPLLDLTRYENARRRAVKISLDPAALPSSGCVPIAMCVDLTSEPVSLAELEPGAKLPYQIQYGLSLERQLGERATGVVSVYSARGIDAFRSVDINAPTPESGYTLRPDPSYGMIRQMQPAGFWEGSGLDISYRGQMNKYFTGFGRYTWSHYESNTGGISWFPQNQYAPNDEWASASFDRRQRLGMYAIFNSKSLFNLATGIFANTGRPWTILTGTDLYGDDLFNTRPEGVAPYTENAPSYVDLDLRWGHDFAITPDKSDEAPRLGFSAGAFNILNHENPSSIDNVETSPEFGQVTAVNPPRRLQLAMRFEF
jgi:Carboxypeptidase regulatory-like domain/TonB dependent receptor